jgi:glycosyltransferase involved in cell wall biosynthesis
MSTTISILIPCYNAAKYLPDLFVGIKLQSIPFTEIICYDDCSTDRTIQIAESLGAIVIRGKENRGPAFARNRLIEVTTASWIHFHDADDLIDASFVETALKHIENDNVQFLFNTYVLDRETRSKNLGNIIYDDLNKTDDQITYFLDNVGFASMGLYSKKALVEIGGFREDIKGNEDPDLHVRLVNAGFKVKCISKYLVTKLEHDTSFSHQNWMRCLEDKLTCYESYLDSLDEKYYKTAGKHISWLGAYFYSKNKINAGKKALLLSKKTGVDTIDTSFFAKSFTRIFGLRLYYIFLQKRSGIAFWRNNKKFV